MIIVRILPNIPFVVAANTLQKPERAPHIMQIANITRKTKLITIPILYLRSIYR